MHEKVFENSNSILFFVIALNYLNENSNSRILKEFCNEDNLTLFPVNDPNLFTIDNPHVVNLFGLILIKKLKKFNNKKKSIPPKSNSNTNCDLDYFTREPKKSVPSRLGFSNNYKIEKFQELEEDNSCVKRKFSFNDKKLLNKY